MESHDVLSEAHEVEEKNRDRTFECGTKCVDHDLGSEVMSNVSEGIELIECNEIVDLHHQDHLADLNLELFLKNSSTKSNKLNKDC